MKTLLPLSRASEVQCALNQNVSSGAVLATLLVLCRVTRWYQKLISKRDLLILVEWDSGQTSARVYWAQLQNLAIRPRQSV